MRLLQKCGVATEAATRRETGPSFKNPKQDSTLDAGAGRDIHESPECDAFQTSIKDSRELGFYILSEGLHDTGLAGLHKRNIRGWF